MDLQTIKDLITIFGFVFLVWNQNRTSQKDIEDKTSQWVKINLKLDALCQSNGDIKDDVKSIQRESSNISTRLSVVEEQIKVANHRIDDLERGKTND